LRRFTHNGSKEFEESFNSFLKLVVTEIKSILPSTKLQAIVLGGGYGRGEGGIYSKNGKECPYNDIEFYLVARGHPRWVEYHYLPLILEAADRLSKRMEVDIEFKIISEKQLQGSKVSMFLYDLAMGHHILWGDKDIFLRHKHLSNTKNIPLSEAMRLGMNRCSGLLFAKQRLMKQNCSSLEDVAFIERNIAKAQLAAGDILLTALGLYHWSCIERSSRLDTVKLEQIPHGKAILTQHRKGVEFKLSPWHSNKITENTRTTFDEMSELMKSIWLWLEGRRLNDDFQCVENYVFSSKFKCDENQYLKNSWLNLSALGLCSLGPKMIRYPRERLLNTFPILLWVRDCVDKQSHLVRIQRQLQTNSNRWDDLVHEYQHLWHRFN